MCFSLYRQCTHGRQASKVCKQGTPCQHQFGASKGDTLQGTIGCLRARSLLTKLLSQMPLQRLLQQQLCLWLRLLYFSAQVRRTDGQLTPVWQHLAHSTVPKQNFLHPARVVRLHLSRGEEVDLDSR